MSPSHPNSLMPKKLLENEHDLPIEHEEASQWPSSPLPSLANIALATKLCSHLAPSGVSPTVTTHNRVGWSAQDCINIDYPDESYIVKVPRNHSSDTAAACRAEMTRARWAEANRLGPAVVAEDDTSGAFAMQFIKGQTLATTELAWQYMPKLLNLLHRCHASPVSGWMGPWDPLAVVHKTLKVATTSNSMAMEDIQLVEQVIFWTQNGIGDVSQLLVPCHNDFHGLNVVLDGEEHLWAIDYEECNLGDPMWDLAYLTATLEIERYELAAQYGCSAE